MAGATAPARPSLCSCAGPEPMPAWLSYAGWAVVAARGLLGALWGLLWLIFFRAFSLFHLHYPLDVV